MSRRAFLAIAAAFGVVAMVIACESDKKGGKVVKISRWSVGPDGKTMHVRFDDTQGHVQEQTGHKVE